MSELEVKAEALERLLREQACSKRMKDARNVGADEWKKELEAKNTRIAELEDQLTACKNVKNSNNECTQSLKLMDELREEKREVEEKNKRITQLEDELQSLKGLARRSKGPEDDNEVWKLELETRNRRIVELEQEMESLENFLREHADTESVRDLEIVIDRKSRRIEELEDTVAEFEDFLKQNPDVKELHDLRYEVKVANKRIQELERWIQKSNENREAGIDQERVIELEEMVTQLEEYVREHNVDVLKRKLQDRECRIEQLQSRVGYLEKELLKLEEKYKAGTDKGTTAKPDDLEQKMKKMEYAISEKDNKLQDYEQQIVEGKNEITRLRKEAAALRKELSECDDIGILKEEIRVRDERIQQLEDEIDSLEKAFNERIDLEQIEELVNMVKEKEDKEQQLSKDLAEARNKIEELSEALRESVVIASDGEKKLKNEEKMRIEALQKIAKLEQRIVSMQTASASKCITCQSLLSKLRKYEKRLERLAEERSVQLADLRQMKREALKAAVSEKDAHLALLELSGIKTAVQSEQADRLKAERKSLLDELKKEDEKSIELSVEAGGAESQGPRLFKLFETSDDEETESGPRPVTTNGDSSNSDKTAEGLEARREQEHATETHADRIADK